MFVVRYAALAALAVWLGGTVLLLAQTTFAGDFHVVAASCGAIIFICLFVMKFIGPPPHAFAIRAALAFLMMAIALYLGVFEPASRSVTTSLMTLNVALGLVLLAWYARE